MVGMTEHDYLTPQQPIEQLMDVQQLADLFRIAPSTFSTWRARGVGPKSMKLGRRLVYKRSEVAAWLERIEGETGRGGAE